MYSWLFWNLLCRTSCPRTQRSTCLRLWVLGLKTCATMASFTGTFRRSRVDISWLSPSFSFPEETLQTSGPCACMRDYTLRAEPCPQLQPFWFARFRFVCLFWVLQKKSPGWTLWLSTAGTCLHHGQQHSFVLIRTVSPLWPHSLHTRFMNTVYVHGLGTWFMYTVYVHGLRTRIMYFFHCW